MSEKTDTINNFLSGYGLSTEEIDLYMLLLKQGSLSALEISRASKEPRTRVYRELDNLISKGFVVKKLHERGSRFTAVSPDVLESLLQEKISNLEKMKGETDTVIESLNKLVTPNANEESAVFYYRGLEGLKQVTWNSLRAKDELLTYEIGNLDSFIPNKNYSERLRLQFVRNKIHIKTLTNLTEIAEWTAVTEMVEKYWQIKHIPKETLNIISEILIYNNVYAMYRYDGDDIFCIEIHNKQLADMQRQTFNLLWNQGKKFTVINKFGEAKL